MFEWLDGYWTAMRHVAAATPPIANGPNIADWVAAIGSVGAAMGAAIAAALTWRIAQKGWQSSVASEKAEMVKISNELLMELSERSLDAEIFRLEFGFRRPKFDVHIPLWNGLMDEISTTGERYRLLGKSALANEKIKGALSIEELHDLRIEIASIRMQMFTVDKVQKGNIYRAAMLEKGIGYC